MAAAKQGNQSRKDFVRGLPPDMKAKEVVERARKAGLRIPIGAVYTLRYLIRKEAGEQPKQVRYRTRKVTTETTPERLFLEGVQVLPTNKSRSLLAAARKERFEHGNIEQQFLQLAVRLGKDRSGELLRTLDQISA